jgi:F-box domain
MITFLQLPLDIHNLIYDRLPACSLARCRQLCKASADVGPTEGQIVAQCIDKLRQELPMARNAGYMDNEAAIAAVVAAGFWSIQDIAMQAVINNKVAALRYLLRVKPAEVRLAARADADFTLNICIACAGIAVGDIIMAELVANWPAIVAGIYSVAAIGRLPPNWPAMFTIREQLATKGDQFQYMMLRHSVLARNTRLINVLVGRISIGSVHRIVNFAIDNERIDLLELLKPVL